MGRTLILDIESCEDCYLRRMVTSLHTPAVFKCNHPTLVPKTPDGKPYRNLGKEIPVKTTTQSNTEYYKDLSIFPEWCPLEELKQ